MLKKIAIVIGVVIALLLVYAATRPDSFRVERTISIKAPPEKVFALINDFHQWTQWSPWENIDPNLKRSYIGTSSGKDSAYAWQGNNKVGQGRMEITEATSPSKIIIKLDFLKPFEAHNTAEFTLAANGGADNTVTDVTWAMYGPSPYLSKLMGVFFSMDNIVGKDFEAGLAKLKMQAEGAS